ncbi:hypothetical protein OQA88_10040 [Cercophora sp. LCS_1]
MEEDQKKLAIAALEAEDVVMQHSYPSPTDASDQHFYHQLTQRDHEMDPDPDHLVQQALASLAEHQGQQNQDNQDETYRLLRTLQEEPSEAQVQEQQPPQQAQHEHHEHHHPHEAVDSAEDLRLAAQLSEAVAPMLAAQNHTQEPLPPPPPPPAAAAAAGPRENTQMVNTQNQEQVAPDLGQQLQAELQNHDRELQNILPHEHHEQSQSAEPEYTHQHEQPDGLPSQLPPLTLDTYHHAQFQLPDNTPPRKRSKGHPCSNCKRANAQCLFSRVPQKRGPSKGYIKELADRIHTIEGKLGSSVEAVLESARRTPVDVFPSPQSVEDSRKRPFSSISGDGFPTPPAAAGRTPIWPGDKQRPLRPQPHPDFAIPYNLNDLAPIPPPTLAPKPATSVLPGNFSSSTRPDAAIPDGLQDELSQSPPQLTEFIDEAAFICYLSSIHPSLPILAESRVRVDSVLLQCPATLQNAFMSAFHDLIRPFQAHHPQTNGVHPGATQHLLSQWELAARPRSPAVDLVELQTLAMMAIGADHREIERRSNGRSKILSINKAVALAYSTGLPFARPPVHPDADLDHDSDEHAALRVWWTLVSFDRWDAMATGRVPIINDTAAVMLPGLKHVVGGSIHHFHCLSESIGVMAPIAKSPPDHESLVKPSYFGPVFNHLMEVIRSRFPDTFDPSSDPHIHLAYWHTRLLTDLFSPTRLHFMLDDCLQIARLLLAYASSLFPLTHHYLALVSIVLVELTKVDEAREKATEILKNLTDHDIAPSAWVTQIREKTVEMLRSMPKPTKEPTAGANDANDANVKTLQQLADVAMAVDPAQEAAPPPPPPPQDGGPASPSPLPAGAAPPVGAQVGEAQENHFPVGECGRSVFDPSFILKTGYLAVFMN